MISEEHAFFNMQSKNVSRENVNGSGVCRHTCACHSEVMDPCLWSKLPEHLLAHVLARLSMPQIFSIGWLSKAWLATSKTLGFKRICAEAHSKTFGVLGFHRTLGTYQVAALDLKNYNWIYHKLTFPTGYPDKIESCLYAHDGGLVCFVSTMNLPILVCNPLTNEWKSLPPIDIKQPVMVQLVMDAETGDYRVIVVCRHGGILKPQLIESIEGAGSRESSISETAEVYDSKTRVWSTMNSGCVYGRDRTEYSLTKVFDCKSKKLLRLSSCSCLKGHFLIDLIVVKNHVFALHSKLSELSEPDLDSVLEVSELADREDDLGVLRILKQYRSTLGSEFNSYSVVLFGSDGFVLLVADNGEENFGEYHHQIVRLYDISHQEWHKLSILNDIYIVENTANHFMCELRWDAFP
jgi:hypothetical protein